MAPSLKLRLEAASELKLLPPPLLPQKSVGLTEVLDRWRKKFSLAEWLLPLLLPPLELPPPPPAVLRALMEATTAWTDMGPSLAAVS